MKKKILIIISIFAIIPLLMGAKNYNYSYYGEVISSSPGMTFQTFMDSRTLGVNFGKLEDLNVYDEKLYVLDSNYTGRAETKYTITFNFDNELIENTIITIDNYELLDEPTNVDSLVENKKIDYWKNESGDKWYFEANRVKSNMTLTAVWIDESQPYSEHAEATLEEIPTERARGAINVINKDYQLEKTVSSFPYSKEFKENRLPSINANTGTNFDKAKILSNNLNNPRGIEVKESGIYIADTNNERVVVLNEDFEIINVIFEEYGTFIEERDEEAGSGIRFTPHKVTVDATGRVYVVMTNLHEGIMEFSIDGRFNRFMGTNKIKLTALDSLRQLLMTEEQKKQLTLDLSTSFNNININQKGFIYTVAKPTKNNNENMIQLLNPKGSDVLKRNGYHVPMGDVNFIPLDHEHTNTIGASNIVDIAHTKNGIYSVLDQKRSRIFTYDQEGNLLYINGETSAGAGTQNDKLETPIAIDYFGDDIVVLDGDQRTKKVVVYSLTDFGTKVNKAIEEHTNGNFEDAAIIWEEVLAINTNYEIAYNGIGKSLIRQKKYKEAMKNFRLGHDQFYYSKAFKQYRNEIIKDNFGIIMLGIVVLVAAPIIIKQRKKIFRKGTK